MLRKALELAKRKGRTAAWIAGRLGVSRQAVSAWSQGVVRPGRDRIEPLRAVIEELRALPTPVPKIVPRRPTPTQRFWKRIRRTRGCWLWTGASSGSGFAKVMWKSESTYAHRVMLEIIGTRIPAGLCVTWTCGRRLCVRPDHMRLVTRSEIARMREKRSHAG